VHHGVRPDHLVMTRFGGVVLTGFGGAVPDDRADPAEDVRQLTATLHELATGVHPDATDDPSRGQVPATMAEPLDRALSEVAAGRLRTALELGQRLRGAELAAGWTPTACYIDGSED